ncbi:hypothetical protein GCM10007276_00820 [Agaricicola taiwanensis]|uniref:TPM domain-containing protein n=1 Tax=Agaricicola taiwanensis TaxID=591372 RepID=A0A8J2YF06_9RHOB|nr:TPM domain-containing protein [Agaricicola taiwanensis]GGE27469.1 hypothetical protein GCM10007276_00820 [Agaricicola taiwanensis]
MTDLLSPADRMRLTQAIRLAEAQTSGEIFVVAARASSDYRLWGTLWSAVIALLVPWPLYLAGWPGMPWLLVTQVVSFVLLSALLGTSFLAVRLTPGPIRRAATRKAALEQFLAHGIHTTEARTGVLIYVSLAEHAVEIIADDGIHDLVGAKAWEGVVEVIRTDARAGRLAEGIEKAISIVGATLAQHWPVGRGDKNELPDRIVVL